MTKGKMLQNAVMLSLLCSCVQWGGIGTGMAAAEETMKHELSPVIVEAQAEAEALPGGMVNKNAKMGILGNKDVMDIPYSEMSMTEKTLETFNDPSQPLANVLLNNPSIRTSTSSPMYTDFSMRGINMNGNHMMLNGIPSLFYQFTTPPAHVIERIDITSGPNAGVNGVSMSNNGTNSGATPAPGTINIVTKRATDTPITRYTQTFSGRGNVGEFIDIGRRFGKDNEWGMRVNAEYLEGGLSLPGAKKDEKNIFINLDHRNEKSVTNIFGGVFDLRVDGGQRWFQFNPSGSYKGNALPSAPDSKMNYDFAGTTKYVHGYLWTLNHEQKMNADWSWFANFGYSRRGGNKDNQGSSLYFDEFGNFTTKNVFNQQNEEGKNGYAQIGIKGNVKTGEIKHNLSLAVDRSWAKYWNKSKSYNPNGVKTTGNLYDGIIFPNDYQLQNFGDAKPQWEETNVGVTIADTLEYGKATLLLAASRKHESLQSFTGSKNIKNDNILPTYGFTYKPVDNLALYAGHTESFSRGLVVANGTYTYTNDGETMDPVKSKQNEVGVKYQNAGMLHTFAYFDIDEANRFDSANPDGTYTKVDDGKNSYQGLEYTINGKLAEKWTVTGGLMYLDAERTTTQGGKKDGFFVTGVSKWSGVLGLEYKPDDDWGIIGRAVWNDDAYIEKVGSSGKYEIPSYVVFDLGVNYKTKINTVPVRLSAMCYNVTGKDYWMGRGGSSTFGLSMPRTFMLSAQFDI